MVEGEAFTEAVVFMVALRRATVSPADFTGAERP